LDSPGGPAADLLASYLRDPNGLMTQLDHLLSSVPKSYPPELEREVN
jgi:hypothetical protein